MNPLNYASLEASKRLHDAGIVLETEVFYNKFSGLSGLVEKITRNLFIDEKYIPAPSMAEVWRGLPDGTVHSIITNEKDPFYGFIYYDKLFSSINPTDALIDLLIWVRKEGGRNDHNSR